LQASKCVQGRILLTTAVQPISIKHIASTTVAVEAANGVGTHLFTTSIHGITFIDVCKLSKIINAGNLTYQVTLLVGEKLYRVM